MAKVFQALYRREKKNPDRTVRCYLSLDCTSRCTFCSTDVSSLTPGRRATSIPAEAWAEGILRRGREVVITGGEPFLYSELPRLVEMIRSRVRVQIYTNLQCDVSQFLAEVSGPVIFLASLHPSTLNLEEWDARAQALMAAGHSVRFHVVKYGDWLPLRNFLVEEKGYSNVTCCGDQRGGIKSRGEDVNKDYPSVWCSGRIFLFGPDGYRYICVRHMDLGGELGRFEHISEPDGPDQLEVSGCTLFGLCAGCDNNIEGVVEYREKVT